MYLICISRSRRLYLMDLICILWLRKLEQLRKHQDIVQWIAQRQEEMHQEETRPAAVDAVVDWLRNQEPEEQANS